MRLKRPPNGSSWTLPRLDALSLRQRRKLYAARLKRTAPFIDQTVYTSWNAMAISAYLHAGRVLHLAAPVEFALKTLDRILAEGWSEASGTCPRHLLCRRSSR